MITLVRFVIPSSVDHPALVKVLDRNLDEEWFVMDVPRGRDNLSNRLEKYKGRALDALPALSERPIVDRGHGCAPRQ